MVGSHPSLSSDSSAVRLELCCACCGHVDEYDVGCVAIHPEREQCKREGWDGIVLGRIIVCASCGAEDEYTIHPMDKLRLGVRGIVGPDPSCAKEIPDGGVFFAELRLWDGTLVKRPSEALRHLRAVAEQQPERGEGWRRLGNFYERYDRQGDAVAAWLRAAEDRDEMEACFSLANHYDNEGELQQAFDFAARTIMRLHGVGKARAAGPVRQAAANTALGIVRAALQHSREPLALLVVWMEPGRTKVTVANLSAVDLRTVRRWDRLADLLASDAIAGAFLTPELPADRCTILRQLLESDVPIGSPFAHRGEVAAARRFLPVSALASAKVGRNEPCPCDSGKKYKKCCGR